MTAAAGFVRVVLSLEIRVAVDCDDLAGVAADDMQAIEGFEIDFVAVLADFVAANDEEHGVSREEGPAVVESQVDVPGRYPPHLHAFLCVTRQGQFS